MKKLSLLFLLMSAAVTNGCIPFWLFDDDDDSPPLVPPSPPPDQPMGDVTPPDIVDVSVPEWPPLGPNSIIDVTVNDAVGLDRLQVQFGSNVHTTSLGGLQNTTIPLLASDVGEGYGPMTFTLFDLAALTDTEQVPEVLVDLTPPEYTVANTVLRPESDLEIWVADAWVLASVEVSVGGQIFTQQFDEGYPASLGIEWDYAELTFPMTDVSAGTWAAVVVVTDAAGNSIEDIFTMTIDAQAPTVQILAPTEGATVSGAFDVTIEASDPEGPVWMTLNVDGAPAATASGPLATVQLPALPAGAHTLEAIATDGAGNPSAPSVVHIDVP
jgi:hypothetical protein